MFRWIHIQVVLRLIPWIAGGIAVAAIAAYASFALKLPSAPHEDSVSKPGLSWPLSQDIDDAAWHVFAPGQPRAPASGGPLSRRFRLAGTFFSFADKMEGVGEESACKAILDDLETKTQVLIGEGEMLDGIQVAQIYRDHIVLRSDGRDEELWLSFSVARDKAEEGKLESTETGGDVQPLETSRFGTRVGEHRWVLNKDALMAYYDEIREDPERIGHLYVSMRPDYREDGDVAGYRLNMTGEEEFFTAAGFREGDVVRKVNSLNMTSQARAEYFIGEFLQGRLSAVVLDIEREDEPQKLIYLIR